MRCRKCGVKCGWFKWVCNRCQNYHFQEEVEVVDGFFKGQKGIVVAVDYGDCNTPVYYTIQLADNNRFQAHWSELRRKNEPSRI